MRVAGIVAEYNPFHTGHLYLLNKVREELGEDAAIVVIMSGDFVQRGIPAISDRSSRACALLSSGADLVLELPFTFATGSADRFARGSILSLSKSTVVTDLFFGAEHDSLEDLLYIASLDPEADSGSEAGDLFHSRLEELQKEGQPYAAAWQEAFTAYLEARAETASEECPETTSSESCLDARHTTTTTTRFSSERLAAILKEPNNILAISYLRELKRCGSDIKPHLVHRENAYHEEGLKEDSFPSATALRKTILERYDTLTKPEFIRSLSDLLPFIPDTMLAEMLCQWNHETRPMGENDLIEAALPLLRASSSEKLAETAHMGPHLAGYLKGAIRNLHYDGNEPVSVLFRKKAETRCFAYTRILRALSSLLVGQTAEDLTALTDPKYLRLLGFSEKGRTVLKAMRGQSELPILSRASDALHYAKDPVFARMDELDRISHDFWTSRARGTFEEDFKREVIQFKRGRLYR
ncbi:MAG: nucleotidyltransferase family protein [Clostridiales bacterium]|nr:nucleotidyltransferase family protein [Clostridiales bacterium]